MVCKARRRWRNLIVLRVSLNFGVLKFDSFWATGENLRIFCHLQTTLRHHHRLSIMRNANKDFSRHPFWCAARCLSIPPTENANLMFHLMPINPFFVSFFVILWGMEDFLIFFNPFMRFLRKLIFLMDLWGFCEHYWRSYGRVTDVFMEFFINLKKKLKLVDFWIFLIWKVWKNWLKSRKILIFNFSNLKLF